MPLYKHTDGSLIKYEGGGLSKDPLCCDCEEAGPCCPLCTPNFTATSCAARDEVWINSGAVTDDFNCCDFCERFGEAWVRTQMCPISAFDDWVTCPGDGKGYWRVFPVCPGDGNQNSFGCPDGSDGCVWRSSGFDGQCGWDENTASCDDPDEPGDEPCSSAHRWVLKLFYDAATGKCTFDLTMDMSWTGWSNDANPLSDAFCDTITFLDSDCLDDTQGVMAHWQLVLSAETDCDTNAMTLTLVNDSGNHCNWPSTVTIQIGLK